MRRLLLLVLALLASAIPARGQSTTVSGTITDQGGQAWFAGTVQFTFRPSNSNPTAQYFWNGAPFDKNTTIPVPALQLDGSGSFSGVSVPSNNFITPSGSTWTVQVTPASTTPSFSQNLTITGATQNISAQIIPPAISLNLSVPLLGARAYTDSEVSGALPGTLYFNNTDNRIHVCLLTGFPPCTWFVLNGGGGTVSSVSSGNFSPLFNVTVTNPTTTPVFSFTALNAAAGTIFGNPSGSAAPPSFNAPSSFSGIGTVTNIATSSPISGGPITTTGTISCPTCVVSVSGTANQITSSGGTTPILSIPSTFIAPGSIQATTSVTATSVTDSGLTATHCVQAGTGGLLTTIANPCPNITSTQIESMTFCPSGCTVTGTPCTTANTGNAECTNAITWPISFADANYAVACQGIGRTNFPFIPFVTKSASVVTVTTSTGENAAATASSFNEIDCQGNHP
jgi:hypothetical protein